MTYPHPDPELTRERLEAKADRDNRCRSCLYGWWGPGFAWCCTHPEHACTDGRRLLYAALGCADRVDVYSLVKAGDPEPAAPVWLGDHCERLHQARLAASRGAA